MSKLVIVESPSKSKTIEKYLGSDYQVMSSKGHIRDLATSGKGGLGIDIEHEFTPNYKVSPDKKEVVKEEAAEEKVAVKEEKEVVDYSSMTLADLKAMAKDAGVKGYSAMKKAELIEALSE